MKVIRTINGKETDITRGVLRKCYTSLNLEKIDGKLVRVKNSNRS